MRTTAPAAAVLIALIAVTGAQQPPDPAAREALAAATAADHQDMLQQLGIRTLRPGPSGTSPRRITPITTKRWPTRIPTFPIR